MPQKSSFFDSTADDVRAYPAREFAEYFSRFVGNGVFMGGTSLSATASGEDANIKVNIGHGWINGYHYSVYDEALTLRVEPATTQDRIDRVILRLDISTPVRAIKALIVQGLPHANPVPPDLVRSGNIYDLSLAQIRVVANTSVILPENITDERLNNQVCGIVTALIDQADTTTIFNQFQAWLDTKTAAYQQQWRDFMETVQDEGFATTQYVDNKVLTGGFGATTNVENAYAVVPNPKPSELVAGLRVVIKVNAANTGAATLNVNGLGAKDIKKGNGGAVAAGNLKAGSVYTLIYDGVSAFILQGEGGSGNAVAGDIRQGKTASTDAGDVVGTLPVRAGGTIVPNRSNRSLMSGIYDDDIIVKGDNNLLPYYIRSGISIFDVVGTFNGTVQTLDTSVYIPANASASVGMGKITQIASVRGIDGINDNFNSFHIRFGTTLYEVYIEGGAITQSPSVSLNVSYGSITATSRWPNGRSYGLKINGA